MGCALLIAGTASWAGVSAIEQISQQDTRAPERAALEALAILPADSRQLLLEAASEPELLRRVVSLQARSSERFRVALAALAPRQQALAWRILSRPDLIAPLRAARSTKELEALLAGANDSVARVGRELALSERSVLNELVRLDAVGRNELETLLAGRPLSVQSSFRLLSADAAAMALLVQEPGLVASVGALYRRDAATTLSALDEVADEALSRHARALPGWAPSSESPPDAAPEAEQVAQESPPQAPIVITATFPLVPPGPVGSGSLGASSAVIPVSVGPNSVPVWDPADTHRRWNSAPARARQASLSGAPHPSRGLSRWSQANLAGQKPGGLDRSRSVPERRLRDAPGRRSDPRFGRLGPETGRRTGLRGLRSQSSPRAFRRLGGGRGRR